MVQGARVEPRGEPHEPRVHVRVAVRSNGRETRRGKTVFSLRFPTRRDVFLLLRLRFKPRLVTARVAGSVVTRAIRLRALPAQAGVSRARLGALPLAERERVRVRVADLVEDRSTIVRLYRRND